MSVYRPFDAFAPVIGSLSSHGFGQHRSLSQQVIESLAGGLQSVYQAEPETDTSEAFADLIARLHRVEEDGH